MKGLNWRVTTVFISVLFCVYLLTPSILKFGFGKTVPRVTKPGDPWYFHVLPSEVLTLGLDLQGGLHLVLGIDFTEVQRDAITKLKNQLQEVAERENQKDYKYEVNNKDEIVIQYPSGSGANVSDLVVKFFPDILEFRNQTDNQALIAIHPNHENEVRKRAIDQSLETLRNRIDEFGIAEANISPQGTDKIQVQFPGVSDPTRIKDIIARTAKLSFQIVRSGTEVPEGPPRAEDLRNWVKEFEEKTGNKVDGKLPFSTYLRELNKFVATKIPEGTEMLFHREVNVNTRQTEYIPYILQREALVTGEDLQDAYYSYDPDNNKPIVNFQLTPVGADKFDKATGANVGKAMAIVLDNNVHSAPRITQRIGGGRAVIKLGEDGSRSTEELQNEAKDTSLVLRSGALPARLLFLEERLIGPSLGMDAIVSGTKSLIYGLLIVLIGMGIYYRASGLVATLALTLNAIIVLACMAAFEATLTLPGLAGLTLTLGMAVDANVLIFEHMREELRKGKGVVHAISEGYRQAFTAILDGNLTTIFAGLVLLGFGYGPIRGFAVTMLIGLVASMYTAVFVTRVVFDYFVVAREKTRLSL
jgi:preprotein translocase subunit SecD